VFGNALKGVNLSGHFDFDSGNTQHRRGIATMKDQYSVPWNVEEQIECMGERFLTPFELEVLQRFKPGVKIGRVRDGEVFVFERFESFHIPLHDYTHSIAITGTKTDGTEVHFRKGQVERKELYRIEIIVLGRGLKASYAIRVGSDNGLPYDHLKQTPTGFITSHPKTAFDWIP